MGSYCLIGAILVYNMQSDGDEGGYTQLYCQCSFHGKFYGVYILVQQNTERQYPPVVTTHTVLMYCGHHLQSQCPGAELMLPASFVDSSRAVSKSWFRSTRVGKGRGWNFP